MATSQGAHQGTSATGECSGRRPSVLRLTWAIDPIHDEGRLLHASPQLLAALSEFHPQIELHVEPVGVLRPRDAHLAPMSLTMTETEQQHFFALAQRHLERTLGRYSVSGLEAVQFLVAPRNSLRTAVSLVLDRASAHGSELVLVAAHGRRGLERWRKGSFTDLLVRQARLPVLVVNPQIHPIRHLSPVIFCTDLSPEAAKVFPRAMALTRTLGSKLLIFHYGSRGSRWLASLPPKRGPRRPFGALGEALGTEKARETARLEALGRAEDLSVEVRTDGRSRGLRHAILGMATAISAPSPLLVLVSRRSGPGRVIRHLFRSSLIQSLIRETVCPLAIFPGDDGDSPRS